MKQVAILYSELADYSVQCFKALHSQNVRILLVHWPINPEAPFQFDLSFCEHYSRDQLSDAQLMDIVQQWQPDLILCSGWMDNGYLNACKAFSPTIPTILSMDNHWTGSLKQRLAQVLAPFTVRKAFNHAFVPGEIQKKYTLKLGFSESRIRTGFYCADVDRFKGYYNEANKDKEVPKRFLYLGRYVQHKGIFDMWEAFRQFQPDNPEWELWCCGTGNQYENRVEGEGIRHFGFLQPDQMLSVLEETGVYVLPSHFEPWGVSVQEMAVAGFPLLLSDAIGAREDFLQEKVNGSVFRAGSVEAIEEKMRWIAGLPNEKLKEMSVRSHETGIRHTPAIWAKKLLSFVG